MPCCHPFMLALLPFFFFCLFIFLFFFFVGNMGLSLSICRSGSGAKQGQINRYIDRSLEQMLGRIKDVLSSK